MESRQDESYQELLDWYRGYLIRVIDVYTDPKTPEYILYLIEEGHGIGPSILESRLNTSNGLLAIIKGDLQRIMNEIVEEYITG